MLNLYKRINRKTYYLGVLIYLFGVMLWLIIVSPESPDNPIQFESMADLPELILLTALITWMIIITRQRANDISGNRSLLWTLFAVLLIGPLIGLLRGEKAENQYGAVPPDFNLFKD